MSGIFLLNFLGRFIWGPLLVDIERDLAIQHTGAGSFFLLISAGYFVGLFLSGHFSSRFNHQRTVVFSAISGGVLLIATIVAPSMPLLHLALVGLGFCGGIYLPTGVACMTYRLVPRDFGKAIAFHEMAPSLGFIIGPLLAEMMLQWSNWRGALLPVAVASILAGIAYSRGPWTGDYRGVPLSIKNMRYIGTIPAFWWMSLPFLFSVGSNVGVFSMLPLYLQLERGMDQTHVNIMLSASRVGAMISVMAAGWIITRFEVKYLLIIIFFLASLFTALLGLMPTHLLWIPILIQPLLAAAFFVPAFSILSRTIPTQYRNLIVALIVSAGMLMGGGAIPTLIGAFGDAGRFHTAFTILGLAAMASTILLLRIPLADTETG